MATKTQQAKPKEAPVAEGIRPNDLAKELKVDGKRIRAFLRGEFPRNDEAKNTNWALTKTQANKVRERFTKKAEDDKAQAES